MADRDTGMMPDDVRFEDRCGCLVLVDPREGDVAAAWPEEAGRYRWRTLRNATIPYPSGTMDQAIDGMVKDWTDGGTGRAARLAAQSDRHSFGRPQIVRRSDARA